MYKSALEDNNLNFQRIGFRAKITNLKKTKHI